MAVEIITRRSDAWTDLVAQRGLLWSEWCELWNSLGPSERDPATHPAWQTAWLATHHDPERDLRVFVCRDANRLLSVVPLEVVASGGQQPSLLAPADVPLEGASLATRRDTTPSVLELLLSTPIDDGPAPLMLEFARVDESLTLLEQGGPGCRIEQNGERSVIPIPENEADLWDRLGSNLRGNLRKAHNKWKRYPDARVDGLAAPEEIRSALDRLAEADARSWKAEHGTDLASDQPIRDFFAAALPQLASEGRSLAHVLFADGRDIGAQLSVKFGDELLVHKIAFDAEYKDCAPGNLLLKSVLEYAPQHGIRRVNLVTSLPWHQRWKPTPAATYRVQVFPVGFRGSLTRLRAVSARDRLRNWSLHLGLLPYLRALRDRLQRNRIAG